MYKSALDCATHASHQTTIFYAVRETHGIALRSVKMRLVLGSCRLEVILFQSTPSSVVSLVSSTLATISRSIKVVCTGSKADERDSTWMRPSCDAARARSELVDADDSDDVRHDPNRCKLVVALRSERRQRRGDSAGCSHPSPPPYALPRALLSQQSLFLRSFIPHRRRKRPHRLLQRYATPSFLACSGGPVERTPCVVSGTTRKGRL